MKITEIMKQAKEMQARLKEQQFKLSKRQFEASSGGGMVIVRVNGKGEVISIRVDPEVVSEKDVGMLQDLIVSAVNEALGRAQEAQQDEMSHMMGGLGLKIPGIS